jgi:hypothetical protein
MGSCLAFAWCSCWRLPLDRFFPRGKWPALGRCYPAGARRLAGRSPFYSKPRSAATRSVRPGSRNICATAGSSKCPRQPQLSSGVRYPHVRHRQHKLSDPRRYEPKSPAAYAARLPFSSCSPSPLTDLTPKWRYDFEGVPFQGCDGETVELKTARRNRYSDRSWQRLRGVSRAG